MPRGNRRPTQKTIAELTGLAVTTVSRALQGDPKIALSTREQVAKVADEIGYVPDRAAQRLRTGKTKVISLILNPHDEILGFSNSLIAGLSQALKGSDYHLTIMPSFAEDDEMDPIRRGGAQWSGRRDRVDAYADFWMNASAICWKRAFPLSAMAAQISPSPTVMLISTTRPLPMRR